MRILATLACSKPGGPHVEHADFTAWFPQIDTVRAVLVLLTGFNGDARGHVDDPGWRCFAERHALGLIGVRFTSAAEPADRRHAYSSAADGSGQALLDAIADLTLRAGHPAAAQAPLLLWGHSAGGQFNYEFACWRPDRVLAFVVNKGGYYATHLAPRRTQQTPGLFIVGERDEPWRIHSLRGIHACNRREGATWTFACEPGVGHALGRTRELAERFFEAVLTSGPDTPRLGDPADGSIHAPNPGRHDLVWLPDAAFAEAWAAFSTASPISA